MTTTPVLPDLPKPLHCGPSGTGSYFNSYTADQMRDYALACAAAQAEPASRHPDEFGSEYLDGLPEITDQQIDDVWVKALHSCASSFNFDATEFNTDCSSNSSMRRSFARHIIANLPAQAVPVLSSQTDYLKEIYDFLASICPPGIADEAFRNVPDSILPYSKRAEGIPFYHEHSDSDRNLSGLARQSSGVRRQIVGAVSRSLAAPPAQAAQPTDAERYVLTKANVDDLISWLRAGHVNHAVIALENLNPTRAAIAASKGAA